MESVRTDWTDPAGGRWELTAHWSIIDGRATLVGLDIHSFVEFRVQQGVVALPKYRPVADTLTELTPRTVRAIPVAAIRETARVALLAEVQRNEPPPQFVARHPALIGAPPSEVEDAVNRVIEKFSQTAAALTAAGQPRKRTPSAGPDVLAEVARLYLATVAAGDKTPVKTVETQLRACGWPVSQHSGREQVRKWVQRARERGLIPPAR